MKPVQFGNIGSVWLVQQDESESSDCEKERRSQSLHDVLSVYSAQYIRFTYYYIQLPIYSEILSVYLLSLYKLANSWFIVH